MVLLACPCTNYRVHVRTAVDEMASALPSPAELQRLFPAVYLVEFGLGAIMTEQHSLTRKLKVHPYDVEFCLCCGIYVAAMLPPAEDPGARSRVCKGYVNTLLAVGQENIAGLRSDRNYSPIFHILTNDESIDSKRLDASATVSSDFDPEKLLESLQALVTGALKREQTAMEERIRQYTQLQHEQFRAMQDRAHLDKMRVYHCIIYHQLKHTRQNIVQKEPLQHNAPQLQQQQQQQQPQQPQQQLPSPITLALANTTTSATTTQNNSNSSTPTNKSALQPHLHQQQQSRSSASPRTRHHHSIHVRRRIKSQPPPRIHFNLDSSQDDLFQMDTDETFDGERRRRRNDDDNEEEENDEEEDDDEDEDEDEDEDDDETNGRLREREEEEERERGAKMMGTSVPLAIGSGGRWKDEEEGFAGGGAPVIRRMNDEEGASSASTTTSVESARRMTGRLVVPPYGSGRGGSSAAGRGGVGGRHRRVRLGSNGESSSDGYTQDNDGDDEGYDMDDFDGDDDASIGRPSLVERPVMDLKQLASSFRETAMRAYPDESSLFCTEHPSESRRRAYTAIL